MPNHGSSQGPKSPDGLFQPPCWRFVCASNRLDWNSLREYFLKVPKVFQKEKSYMKKYAVLSLVLSVFVPAASSCIGNKSTSCKPGETCVCSGIGNCDIECPGGDCIMICQGTGNCKFDCEGGGCSVACQGTGNCNLSCEGGECSQHCSGSGNCILSDCSFGCSLTCENIGTCVCSSGCD